MDLKKHYKSFCKALLHAFPQPYELRHFAEFQFHKNIDQDFSGPLKQKAFELIEWADAEGLCDKLFAEALREKPNNELLRSLADTFSAEVRAEFDQTVEALSAYRSSEENNPKAAEIRAITDLQPIRKLVVNDMVTGHLQALAVNSPLLQSGQAIEQWVSTLQQRYRAICSICKNGRNVGTGFLIGLDTIMTNCHVTDRAGIATADVCFDYVDGVNRNKLPKYKVAAELGRSGPKECDYSILQLASVPSGNRVAIPASPRALTIREPVYVLGYPGESPLRLSSGAIWDENSFVGRAAYSANTQPGSSGSPVFDEAWRLIALHHHGEDNMNNHGIPMRGILENLKQQGLAHLLPSAA